MKPDMFFHCRSITLNNDPVMILSGNAACFYRTPTADENGENEEFDLHKCSAKWPRLKVWRDYEIKRPKWYASFSEVYAEYQLQGFGQ